MPESRSIRSTPDAPAADRSGRALETRTRLLAAGRRAFAEKGLAGANLRSDILEPAGVSVGSFYHQFEDKTELLLAILAEHSERFRARIRDVHRPRPGRSLEQLIRDAYELLFDEAETHADVMRIQLRERHSGSRRVREFLRDDRERWLDSLTEDFRRVQDAAGLPPFAEGAAELIVALAVGSIMRLLETGPAARRATRARLVDNLVRFSLSGMSGLLESGADAASDGPRRADTSPAPRTPRSPNRAR